MNQVTKALTADEIARVEARNGKEQQEATEGQTPAPAAAKIVGGKERTRTIPLEWPIEYDGAVYDQLTVRRVGGTDFKTIASMAGKDEEIHLAAMLTGVPPQVIEALDGDDFITVQEAVKDFLPRKLQAAAGQVSETGPNTPQ